MKKLFTMLMIPVIGIALSLTALPTVARSEVTDKKIKTKKKKKSTSTGLTTVASHY